MKASIESFEVEQEKLYEIESLCINESYLNQDQEELIRFINFNLVAIACNHQHFSENH